MIKLQKVIDKYLGSLICLVLSLFLKKKNKIFPKKILLIKLWALGESILTLPLIEELRKKFPEAKIDVLCRKINKDVFTLNKEINEILILEKEIFNLLRKRKKYDLVFDCEPYLNISSVLAFWLGKQAVGFSHGIRSRLYTYKVRYNDQQHVVFTYLNLLIPFFTSINKPKKLPKINYSKEDKNTIEKYLKENYIKETDFLVGICATSAESAKSRIWLKERFAQVIEYLIKEKEAKVVLIGTKKDFNFNQQIIDLVKIKDKKKVLNAAGKTNVKQLVALIEKCDLFISNDTGPMHLAAALGVKTIGLFGPNLPIRFAPFGENNIAIYKKVPCSPCINVHLGKIKECKNPICMKKITVKEVINAINQLIQKKVP